MNTLAKASGLIVLAALLTACGPGGGERPAGVDTAKIVDTIKADEVRWNADYKSGDAAKMAAHFAPRATVMAPGAAPVVGIAAIEADDARMIGDPAFGFSFTSDEVRVASSGDLAVSRGRYLLTRTDPGTRAPVTSNGSFVTLYKPQPGGAWKAVWDIATPGPPASAGVAPKSTP